MLKVCALLMQVLVAFIEQIAMSLLARMSRHGAHKRVIVFIWHGSPKELLL